MGLLLLMLLLQLQLPLWVSAGAPGQISEEEGHLSETAIRPSGEISGERPGSIGSDGTLPSEARRLSLTATSAAQPRAAVDAEMPAESPISDRSQAKAPQMAPPQAYDHLIWLPFGLAPQSEAQEGSHWAIQGVVRMVPLQAATFPARENPKGTEVPYGGNTDGLPSTEAAEEENYSVGPLQRRSERAVQLLLCACLMYAFVLLIQKQQRVNSLSANEEPQQTADNP